MGGPWAIEYMARSQKSSCILSHRGWRGISCKRFRRRELNVQIQHSRDWSSGIEREGERERDIYISTHYNVKLNNNWSLILICWYILGKSV